MRCGSALWQNFNVAVYPEAIWSRILSRGRCQDDALANAVGAGARFECGAFVRFSLRIDDGTGAISGASYKTNGCGHMAAAAEVLAEHLAGSELTALGGFSRESARLLLQNSLGEPPPGRGQCAMAAIEAAKNAFANHRSQQLEEFQGEKAIICTCFGVSEETIAKLIIDNDLSDVSEVSDACRAGSGCGACQMLIRDVIESVRYE